MSKKPLPRRTLIDTDLPDPATVDKAIDAISTGTPRKKTFTAADRREPGKSKRQPGTTAKGRVKFTTMLKKDLRIEMERIAQNRQISIADVLEQILVDYFAD
jgi:hypothetical protein